MQNRSAPGYLEWEKVKDFEEAGVVVTVMTLKTERPRYSFEVSVRTQPGRTGRRFPLSITGQGKVSVKKTDTAVLNRLIEQAEDFVTSLAQKFEDQMVAKKLAHEMRDLTRGQPKGQPLGIKSLGKRDKAKREAAAAAQDTNKPSERCEVVK